MRAYKVTMLLLFLCVLFSATCGGMVYYTRQGAGHSATSAQAATIASVEAKTAADKAASGLTYLETVITLLQTQVGTDHATTLERDKQLATILAVVALESNEIHTLLTNGHSASATAAKEAATSAKEGDELIARLFDQLQAIQNAVCSVAKQDGVPATALGSNCGTAATR